MEPNIELAVWVRVQPASQRRLDSDSPTAVHNVSGVQGDERQTYILNLFRFIETHRGLREASATSYGEYSRLTALFAEGIDIIVAESSPRLMLRSDEYGAARDLFSTCSVPRCQTYTSHIHGRDFDRAPRLGLRALDRVHHVLYRHPRVHYRGPCKSSASARRQGSSP